MADQAMVTRIYRAAIKIGDDYITIEETISLPPNASNDDIAEAIETGLRIYEMQQHAVQSQLQSLREHHQAGPVRILDPESPASEKQRSYLEYLATTLNIADDTMETMLRERQSNYESLTKGVASEVIDQLKQQLEARGPVTTQTDGDTPIQPTLEEAVVSAKQTPASTRQIAALQRVGAQHKLDVAAEARNRYGTENLEDLTTSEAGALLQALQRH